MEAKKRRQEEDTIEKVRLKLQLNPKKQKTSENLSEGVDSNRSYIDLSPDIVLADGGGLDKDTSDADSLSAEQEPISLLGPPPTSILGDPTVIVPEVTIGWFLFVFMFHRNR